ncbi:MULTISPECIES: MNIO family bufferin maturase [Halomonas]|uniref:UPF0276 protein n=1 Tax=Halomonas halophila TaxID=29573 RepID=A0ABQ0U0R2_9GAMM|nr:MULTISPECIES: DUF692 domain-containing protein [Halomonas]MDR5888814.1 DUF692 domain-containing protein [Halomonas salina]WJY07994.1 DUF692 domain-containing protein [Halomonas halophila]GEK72134.1 UPF0276 protein [Halomonas halophila]
MSPSLTPNAVGIGFKPQHAQALLAAPRTADFLELHAENHMSAGGPAREELLELAERYPLSVHGVGLSLGGAERPDPAHLARLVELVNRLSPALVSEHLAWSRLDGDCYNDLLPVPLTEESLTLLARNIDIVQQALGRRLLIENPSLYVTIPINTLDEADFLTELVARTGCGLLLDLNNAYICAHNLGRDLDAYLAALPWQAVGEMHLAGHSLDTAVEPPLRIDDHGGPVTEAVWSLYRRWAPAAPEAPTLIEWDANVPTLDRWLEEAELARAHRATALPGEASRDKAPRRMPA